MTTAWCGGGKSQDLGKSPSECRVIIVKQHIFALNISSSLQTMQTRFKAQAQQVDLDAWTMLDIGGVPLHQPKLALLPTPTPVDLQFTLNGGI